MSELPMDGASREPPDGAGSGSPDAAGTGGIRRGEAITLGNEFAEVRISRIDTRNGARLLIESPKSGQWVTLCPLEVEALTWQGTATFAAMLGNPFAPLVPEDEPE
jgi:hypothetical protein